MKVHFYGQYGTPQKPFIFLDIVNVGHWVALLDVCLVIVDFYGKENVQKNLDIVHMGHYIILFHE